MISPPGACYLCFGKTNIRVIHADFSKGFGMMICEKLLIYRRWEVVRALAQRLKGDTTVGSAEMKIGCWRTVT